MFDAIFVHEESGMDYPHAAASPGLSQASCGSPNYDSEFTSNGSPGQCSLRSDMSMSPGRLSPSTLQEKYSVFDRHLDPLSVYTNTNTLKLNINNNNNNTTKSYQHHRFGGSQDSMCSTIKSSSSQLHHAYHPCSPVDELDIDPMDGDDPLSPASSSGLGAVSPSALITSGLSTPSAVLNHTNFVHAKFELKAFTRPSETIDEESTSTPYTDATKPKKQAKEGRIKRPMNAFMVWAQQERRALTELKPELHNADISKHLGQVWKNMSEEEKKVWRDEAARLKELHDREFPFYKYQPRKNKNKLPKKPVKTESGRVSKPSGKNRDLSISSSTSSSSATKVGGAKPGRSKAAGGGCGGAKASKTSRKVGGGVSGGVAVCQPPVGAEVNSSLVSMLQAGPHHRFQNLAGAAVTVAYPSSLSASATSPTSALSISTSASKQFNRVVIDDEFRKGVRESQKVPSSTEQITPPAQSGDKVKVEFPVVKMEFQPSPTPAAPGAPAHQTFYNPAFRPGELYQAPTPSPSASSASACSPPPPSVSPPALMECATPMDVSLVIKTETDTDTALLLDELPHAVTPAAVLQVGDSWIVSKYQSGATVTYNRDTKERKFSHLAPLQAIPDLSNISDALCISSLADVAVDPTVCEEIDNIRNFISDAGIGLLSWEGLTQDAVTDNDLGQSHHHIHDSEVEFVSEKMPDNIFAPESIFA